MESDSGANFGIEMSHDGGFCSYDIVAQCLILHIEYILISCGSVVEHCVNSAKGCGFNSQVTHILIKKN